ncbi:hypothetical protein IU498_30955 [Nocardia beijingensis]|nr:hypothetical protein [Nocardia beijingensis]
MTEAIYEVDAIVGFPWTKWDFKTAYPGGRDLETAADAARVLTAVICGERFSDGTILAALTAGTLTSALQRLRTWHEQQTDR